MDSIEFVISISVEDMTVTVYHDKTNGNDLLVLYTENVPPTANVAREVTYSGGDVKLALVKLIEAALERGLTHDAATRIIEAGGFEPVRFFVE